jgi:aryl-alcohol dehydrogenase-like predicted oxidoreductase
MEYRNLGRSGVKVSPVCLGSGNFGEPTPEDDAVQIIHHALASGINFIDTANSYAAGESERIIGTALNQQGQRHRVIVATKFHYPAGSGPNDRGNSRLHIIQACEDSLRRLQTDYIDLYQLHRPDFDIPVEETLGALTDLIQQGKIRYIGCSTHPAWKIMEAIMMSELKGYARFVSEQPPYNLLDRRIENEIVPLCQTYGLAVLPWAPMGQGILAGRYANADYFPSDSRAAMRGGIYAERITAEAVKVGLEFVALAQESGISPAQLAILWAKEQPGITAPIFGPRTREQLEHILPVLAMRLDDSLRVACDDLVPPGKAVGNFYNSATWMK